MLVTLFKNYKSLTSYLAFSLAMLIVTVFNSAEAKPALSPEKLETLTANQKKFLLAEEAILNEDFARYRTLKTELAHYPLLSYLEFTELSQQLVPENRKAIDTFISMHKTSSPLSNRLRNMYLKKLAEQNKLDLFSEYFSENYMRSKNSKLVCQYLLHQLDKTKNQKELFSRVTQLWVNPKSQPKQCDILFEHWKQAGYLSHDVAYQRFYKAAHNGSINLLSFLEPMLAREKRYLAKMWQKVRKDPGVITKNNFFPKKNIDLEAPMIVYAMKKLAWGERDKAYRAWRKVKQIMPLTKEYKKDIERTLFLALATENNDKSLIWAKKLSDQHLDDSLVNHWILATFLRSKQWTLIKELYKKLPAEQQQSSQWLYWNAIAIQNKYPENATKDLLPLPPEMLTAEQLVMQQDLLLAQTSLEKLSSERDYYGYKAATRLQKPLLLNHKSAKISPQVMQQVKDMANAEKAKELFILERYTDASREWRTLLKRLTTDEQINAAAKIAHNWGWYNQAIVTIAKAKTWDETLIRFPTAFKNGYQAMAKKVNLPAQWLMGVTRQESAYGPFAVSGAGAYGLMQVLPSTAKVYSKKFDIDYSHRKDLFIPDTNIEMGSRYLELRFQELEKNPIYASAAYNAGKNQIERWKHFGRFPTEIWVESIPYTETRDYIKKVMTYRAIYALKLGVKDYTFNYILNTETGGILPEEITTTISSGISSQ